MRVRRRLACVQARSRFGCCWFVRGWLRVAPALRAALAARWPTLVVRAAAPVAHTLRASDSARRRRPGEARGCARQPDRPRLGRLQIGRVVDLRRRAAVADRALRRAGRRWRPVTYYIITGLSGSEAGYDTTWSQAIADGSEVGNHTAHHCHADLTGCTMGTALPAVARRAGPSIAVRRRPLPGPGARVDRGVALRRHGIRQRRRDAVPGQPRRQRRHDRREGQRRIRSTCQPTRHRRTTRRRCSTPTSTRHTRAAGGRSCWFTASRRPTSSGTTRSRSRT